MSAQLKTLDLAEPCEALMSALGGVTSIFFNAVVGSIIDRFGYDTPFWVGACLHPLAAGVLAWHFLRKRPE